MQRLLVGTDMASNRRIGSESSEKRSELLDAAEQLMLEEGYAAVSSRRIAQKAGLKPQLVHYYFRTMDELFLAAFRRRAEIGLVRQARALGSGQPLRALWSFSDDPASTALTMEYAALANHRKSIRTEIARYGELFRRQQTEALSEVLGERGIDTEELAPDRGDGSHHGCLADPGDGGGSRDVSRPRGDARPGRTISGAVRGETDGNGSVHIGLGDADESVVSGVLDHWIGSSPEKVVRCMSRGELGSYGLARCSTPRLSQITTSPTCHSWR